MSMRAVVFDGADRPLVLDEKPEANLAPDEVRIDIAACGICGSDLHMAHAPESFGLSPGSVLGHEFAGTVCERGSEVTSLQVGDRVAVAPIRGCGNCRDCAAGEPAWCKDMSLIGGDMPNAQQLLRGNAGSCLTTYRFRMQQWPNRRLLPYTL